MCQILAHQNTFRRIYCKKKKNNKTKNNNEIMLLTMATIMAHLREFNPLQQLIVFEFFF